MLDIDYADLVLDYKKLANERGIYGNSTLAPIGQLDDLDAFRHAYASGVATKYAGEFVASAAGALVELLGGNDPAAREMDEHNNAVGREIGLIAISTENIADLVAQAVKDGSTINEPRYKDPFEGKKPPIPTPKPEGLGDVDESKLVMTDEDRQELIDEMTDFIVEAGKKRMKVWEGRWTGEIQGEVINVNANDDK